MKISRIVILVLAFVLGAVFTPTVFSSGTNNVEKMSDFPEDLRSFLIKADEFVLLSLNPTPDFEKKAKVVFKGHAILGETKIEMELVRSNLVFALAEGIRAGSNYDAPSCFNPRHGIRAKRGDKTIELLICFECLQVVANSSTGEHWYFITLEKPAAIFNRVLRLRGVPLPKN